MVVKELIEARWKLIAGAVIITCISAALAATYDLLKNLTQHDSSLKQLPSSLQNQVQQLMGTYAVYVWGQWFSKTGPEVLAVLAAVLGASLIASEVSKGTIFFLLSKPISRERVLLVKYAVSALILLGVMVLSSAALLVAAAILGYPQNIGGMAVSTLLLWLGMLFVLGLALLFSVLFKDVLRPLIFALLIPLVLSIPGYIPGWGAWNLTGYWADFSAYLGQSFPTKAFIICLIAALVPLVAAIPLFRKQAY
jgi:ABC-2 type transport system permease protein